MNQFISFVLARSKLKPQWCLVSCKSLLINCEQYHFQEKLVSSCKHSHVQCLFSTILVALMQGPNSCMHPEIWEKVMLLPKRRGQTNVGRKFRDARWTRDRCTIVGGELVLKWLKLQVLVFQKSRRKSVAWLVLCWEQSIRVMLEKLVCLLAWDSKQSDSNFARLETWPTANFVYFEMKWERFIWTILICNLGCETKIDQSWLVFCVFCADSFLCWCKLYKLTEWTSVSGVYSAKTAISWQQHSFWFNALKYKVL